ncbi:MAG TPA: membrane protein insertase YidC [Wenzhouxiangella sp.]|nr:membrane protein insertase YidC [Wenzhouxiangella sp.]
MLLPRLFGRSIMSAVVVALLLCVNGPAAAAPSALDTASVRVAWDAHGTVTSWDVALPESAATAGQWRSLVSTDPTGERISRHLAISLPGVSDWQRVDAASGDDALAATWLSADGNWRLKVALTPTEQPWRQQLDIHLEAVNAAPAPARALALQLGPGIGEIPMAGLGIARSLYSYTDAVAYSDGDLLRLAGDDDSEPAELGQGGWLGLHSRYFALLAAPVEGPGPVGVDSGRAVEFESPGPDYLPWIRLQLPLGEPSPGKSKHWRLALFSGPKTQAALAGGGGAVDHSPLLFNSLWSWMRTLSLGLLWVLAAIHALVPSWGLAICLLAVLVRVLLYPLGRWALSSQQRFSEVQAEIAPKVREIKQNYRGGEQSERILQLYEARGVSPLAGLKPLLIVGIQIPVFVALFHVLGQVFEFRDASFLWIESLAEPDRLFAFGFDLPFFGGWFNLLPVLMAISTLASIRLSPAPAASPAEKRRQNVFLWLMALAFFLLFYPFPSGMVLYWIVANLLYIAQFQLMRRRGGQPA